MLSKLIDKLFFTTRRGWKVCWLFDSETPLLSKQFVELGRDKQRELIKQLRKQRHEL